MLINWYGYLSGRLLIKDNRVEIELNILGSPLGLLCLLSHSVNFMLHLTGNGYSSSPLFFSKPHLRSVEARQP